MSLVMVKDKFQVTIPARLRQELDLKVGDMLEAVIDGGKIVLRPKAVVGRATIADRLNRVLALERISISWNTQRFGCSLGTRSVGRDR